MREVFQILNDRITVNIINGKTEAVAALREVREAISVPLCKAEGQLIAAIEALEGLEGTMSALADDDGHAD